ncbi:MAG: DUF5686 and carboxypeptidase regulatory-like domain-containing protein [Niabella sp.]
MRLTKPLPVVLLTLFGQVLYAQEFTLKGKITTTRLEPIPLATVQLKASKKTMLSGNDGSYSFELPKGIYEIVVTMVGYQPRVVSVVVDKQDVEQNIILSEDAKTLTGVTVKSKAKDRAEDYVRQVIRHKDELQQAAGAYSCDVYIKAVKEDSIPKPKNQKPSKDSIWAKNPSPGMSLAEIVLHLDYASPTRYKEERTGIKRNGDVRNLFFLSTTEGRFDFYDNLVKVPALSSATFLSPISYSGLLAYKYKTLKTENVGNHHVHTISVRPGSLSNATVSGEMVIDDSTWTVLSLRFAFPKYHLPMYDYFEVTQKHEFVNNAAWMVTHQAFSYYSKDKHAKSSGTTTVGYRNFELNKTFPPRYFGPEMSATTLEAYRRDSNFWNTTRTVPLTDKEVRLIKYTDSVRAVVTSKAYRDSVDSVTNKVNWKKIVYKGQELSYHEKGINMYFPAMLSLATFSFGGLRLQFPFRYYKTDSLRKTISINASPSYGLLNKDINGYFDFRRKYNPFNQAYFSVTLQREFASIFSGDAWINQLKRANYYLDNSIGLGWGCEIANGFMFHTKWSMSLRRSLAGYKTYNFVDSIFSDIGEGENKAPDFEPYNAFYGSVELRYTPFQPYVREPFEKILLEPKWPTFYVKWRKGMPDIFNSKVNFDYLELGVEQFLRMGLLGNGQYSIKSGSFLNKKNLQQVDYKYQRRGDPFLFMNPYEAFQSMDSSFAVFKRFYEGHYVHEFNGALFNKIPLFKKIGLREVAGAGFLIAPERNLRYAEAFAGVEHVFRWPFGRFQKFKLGAYVTGSVANQYKDHLQFKVGITTWNLRDNKWN